ncbi:MAG: hypothetical protein M1839_003877 [Geoglossum umbratile]|nr:MAG: hypothetical protein M1839_003877 [Geoglossum umbratile]
MDDLKPPKPASIKAVAISEPEVSQHIPNTKFGSGDAQHLQGGLAAQVLNWLQGERARRASRKEKRKETEGFSEVSIEGLRRPSESSEGSDSLDRLEQILAENATSSSKTPSARSTPRLFAIDHRGSAPASRRQSSSRKLRRSSGSSDTDRQDGDVGVPRCDVILKNPKAPSYSSGTGASDAESLDQEGWSRRAQREPESWNSFKNDIVRLAHTLNLSRWRRIPLDHGGEIKVERISGALTNAVYMVSPPEPLPLLKGGPGDSAVSLVPTKPPPKLLLRIYGPQVEHLIDRDAELQVLQRLARKKIGPRLLGTFSNGRFEEFFHASTLTYQDIRIPDTSKGIAKRMRELHDGIELLEKEREAGPSVWKNWDKWVERSEQIVSWVDRRMMSKPQSPNWPKLDSWKDRGLICGVEWPFFRSAVERYRGWLSEKYGGLAVIKQQLIFAHNDAQYGNILRLQPSGKSQENEHKQLVVIDFEYAGANLPGLEFANHFTEWCYNYHDPEKPHALDETLFPTPIEQRAFVKAYVEHCPDYFHPRPTSGSRTPGSISTFTLDTPVSPLQTVEDEAEQTEKEIERLMRDARLWRAANSAQWVAWGIVQAHVPEVNNDLPIALGEVSPISMTSHFTEAGDAAPAKVSEVEDSAEDGNEFDYLAYAQERAMFFWGDLLSLGVISTHELPPQLLPKLKIVNY